MSDLERDLRATLARRAGATPTNPGDWQDLTVRMARRNRRSRRVMAGAMALVLIAGPLAGFAFARAVQSNDTDGDVTAGGRRYGSSDAITTAEGAATLRASAQAGLIAGLPLEKLFRRTGGDDIAIRAFITRGLEAPSCQGDGWCPPSECFPDGSIVGQLSTEAAVGIATSAHYRAITPALRVTGGGVFGANGEGSPARWVIAQTSDRVAKVRVSFEGGGDDEMAPVDGVVLLAALTDPTKSGGTVEALDGSGAVIGSEDAEVTWLDTPLYVGGTASVSAIDERAVISGSSAVKIDGTGSSTRSSSSASSSSSSSSSDSGTATSDASTTTVPTAGGSTPDPGATTTTVVPGTGAGAGGGVAVPPPADEASQCVPPPPTLPAPGEQPADPAAARAEIEHAFALSLDGSLGDTPEKSAVVEDSESLVDVMAKLREGSFAQQVKDASGKVTEIVFTSPTEAAVRYDINVANYSDFTGRIGRAKLIDGHWKVARVTACADIALAGVTCPPQ